MKGLPDCRTTEAELRAALRVLTPAVYTTEQARAEEVLLRGIEDLAMLQRAFSREIQRRAEQRAECRARMGELPVIHTRRWKTKRGA